MKYKEAFERLFSGAFFIALIAGLFYYFTSQPDVKPLPTFAGWDGPGDCTDLTSFDDKKSLTLLSDGKVRLGDSSNKDETVWYDGEWALISPENHTYSVKIAQLDATYKRVSSQGGDRCILVFGSEENANLPLSWFSTPIDDTRDEDMRDDYMRP